MSDLLNEIKDLYSYDEDEPEITDRITEQSVEAYASYYTAWAISYLISEVERLRTENKELKSEEGISNESTDQD